MRYTSVFLSRDLNANPMLTARKVNAVLKRGSSAAVSESAAKEHSVALWYDIHLLIFYIKTIEVLHAKILVML